jgi:hypothetical protein
MQRAYIFAGLSCLLLLSACQTYPAVRGYGQQSIEQIKQINDDYAYVAATAVCATTIGAHYRDKDVRAQAARSCLCGGPCEVQVKFPEQ